MKKNEIIGLANFFIAQTVNPEIKKIIMEDELFMESFGDTLEWCSDSFDRERFINYVHKGIELQKKGIAIPDIYY